MVILQEYSTRTAFDEERICRDTVAPLDTLVSLIKQSSPNATIQVSLPRLLSGKFNSLRILFGRRSPADYKYVFALTMIYSDSIDYSRKPFSKIWIANKVV